MDVLQSLLSQLPLLVVSIGFMALQWRAIGAVQAAQGESATLAQLLARLLAGQEVTLPPSVASPVPAKAGSIVSALTPKPVPPTPPVPTASDDTVVDQGLVDFIKKQEGFSAKAYWDYKQWSIGYGTKAKSADEVITEAEAESRLRTEIAVADKLVTNFVTGLPKGIHQALLDLTYNAGSGWEQGSLGRAVKDSKWDTVKADILLYNHAGGQVNEGLTKRRQAEVSWFDNPL